jgi:hypothetical protein
MILDRLYRRIRNRIAAPEHATIDRLERELRRERGVVDTLTAELESVREERDRLARPPAPQPTPTRDPDGYPTEPVSWVSPVDPVAFAEACRVKVGDRVTEANVGALPVGAVVKWMAAVPRDEVLATKTGPNKWHGRWPGGEADDWDDDFVSGDEPPSHLHSLPPSPDGLRNCGTCVHAFEAAGYGPGLHCGLTVNNPGSFWDNVRHWQTNREGCCPGHEHTHA